MHTDHGGNGRSFTDEEASGQFEMKETDVSMVLESVARDVISGKITLDQAAATAGKAAEMSSAQAREAVTIMMETLQGKEESMTEKKATAAKKSAIKAPRATSDRRAKEKTDASEFIRVRDDLGMTSKQAAEATGEAGMGSSATYVYILTHSGASTDLFKKYEAALRSYAKKNKVGPFETTGRAARAPRPVVETSAPSESAVEVAEDQIAQDESLAAADQDSAEEAEEALAIEA